MNIIKIYEEQIERLQQRIVNIKRDCQHLEYESMRVLAEDESYWEHICKKCGLIWREHKDDNT